MVELIKKGDKVGSSEAALLAKLGIRPFSYGLIILSVYDNGSVFSPEVLDLTEDDLIEKFASVSPWLLHSLLPSHTQPLLLHLTCSSIPTRMSWLLQLQLSIVSLRLIKLKEYLADPSKFAVAADAGAAPTATPAVEEKKPEPEEESDDDMGFSLFD